MISSLFKKGWIIPILLVGLVVWLYSMKRAHSNIRVYEVEALPYGLTGEPNSYDKLASNHYARHVSEADVNDRGKAVFFGPYVDLQPGNYRVSFTVRAGELRPVNELLYLDVTSQTAVKIIASHRIAPRQLSSQFYRDVTIDFSLSEYTPRVQFRAFYPGEGDYWLDRISLVKRTAWDMAWQVFPFVAVSLIILLFVCRWLISKWAGGIR